MAAERGHLLPAGSGLGREPLPRCRVTGRLQINTGVLGGSRRMAHSKKTVMISWEPPCLRNNNNKLFNVGIKGQMGVHFHSQVGDY